MIFLIQQTKFLLFCVILEKKIIFLLVISFYFRQYNYIILLSISCIQTHLYTPTYPLFKFIAFFHYFLLHTCIFFLLCICVIFCVYVHILYECSWRPVDIIKTHGTEVISGCQLPNYSAGNETLVFSRAAVTLNCRDISLIPLNS